MGNGSLERRHNRCWYRQQAENAAVRVSWPAKTATGTAINQEFYEGSMKCVTRGSSVLLCLLLLFTTPTFAQQVCVDLAGSTACPAFNASRIATNLTGIFPFLANVTDVRSFDAQLAQYVNSSYAQQKYQNTDFFGCSNVNLSNTTNLYARYTYSFICNAIIQNSLTACSTTPADNPPLCADSCADFVESEETILSSPQLCGSNGPNAVPQLRADFTNCAQPQNSLNSTCIPGSQNERDNCGFQDNLVGLCTYCSTSAVNNTNSCCLTSQSEQRCSNVRLPVYSSVQPLPFTTTLSASPTSTAAPGVASGPSHGLSGGAIAGIVIGAVVGAGLLLALLICCCLLMRRKRGADAKTSLNQPTPYVAREKPSQSNNYANASGARVTRMAALEHPSNDSPNDGTVQPQPRSQSAGATLGGIAARGTREKSSTEGYDESSPESQGYTSGEGGATGQSEQLDSFKDYYSNDEIHPGDAVSTLWAYSPRANDEFELERGDMLRIVGIWDDGWATGVRINQRAEQWEPGRNVQRDSGLSGGTAQEPPPQNGDVKAFPLVCVCLPQHWRKTVEGDTTEPDLSSDGLFTD